MNKITINLSIAMTLAFGLAACSPKEPNKTPVKPVGGNEVVIDKKDVVKTPDPKVEWCLSGKSIELSTVTSKGWVNGVGRDVPSILLEMGALDGVATPTKVLLPNEKTARKVRSIRTYENGRQVIKLSGDDITDKEGISKACFITE